MCFTFYYGSTWIKYGKKVRTVLENDNHDEEVGEEEEKEEKL